MVFIREAQPVNWDLSSFLKVNGNSENVILENQDQNSESHFQYWLSEYNGIKDYCNIKLIINKVKFHYFRVAYDKLRIAVNSQ